MLVLQAAVTAVESVWELLSDREAFTMALPESLQQFQAWFARSDFGSALTQVRTAAARLEAAEEQVKAMPEANTQLGAAVLACMAVAQSAVVTGRLALIGAFCYEDVQSQAISYTPAPLVIITWLERALQAHLATARTEDELGNERTCWRFAAMFCFVLTARVCSAARDDDAVIIAPTAVNLHTYRSSYSRTFMEGATRKSYADTL